MFHEIIEFLEGLPMTIVGGVSLAISLLLSLYGVEVAVDPAWIAFFVSGIPLIALAAKRLMHNRGISKISSALLIVIAMFAAIGIGDIFAAGEVAFIMAIGEMMEDKTTDRARRGLETLMTLAPTQGRRILPDGEELIPAEEIRQGDLLRILPGETIPADGRIIRGTSSVDQSVMTGESLPVDKTRGDEVFCGTINCFGSIDICATGVGEESSLQKLIRMVEEAEEHRAPMQRIADKAASYLVPAALLTAVLAFVFTQDIVRAVTILVVFCPCALVLATPTAIMAAIGQATKHGVIIKSGEALENMGRVDAIAFDKTGTLTYGHLQVGQVIALTENLDEWELLRLGASAEARSEHPLGKAIVAAAQERGLSLLATEEFAMEAGRGICARLSDWSEEEILCGSEQYLAQRGIILSPDQVELSQNLRNQGKAVIWVGSQGGVLGLVALTDEIRPHVGDMLARLTKLKVESLLLTGDHGQTAAYVAGQVGITRIFSRLLPEDKVAQLARLQEEGRQVCMIGDGVNDAPALKAANVGVAMGGMGSDIAVEAADIVLMQDDLSRIPYVKRLANATVSTIRLSITLSLIINIVAILLSLWGLLTPTTGALVHNAGSCFVVLIAALLYDRKSIWRESQSE